MYVSYISNALQAEIQAVAKNQQHTKRYST